MTLDQHPTAANDEELLDIFGRPITGQRNDGDLPGHYKATPERYRLYVDGSRVNYYYPSVSQSSLEDTRTDETDVYVLTPDAGQTVRFETAERLRYIVGYESEATMALSTNQSLQGDDEVIVYIGRDDGYRFEFTADGCDIHIMRGGASVASRTVPTAVGLTVYARFVVRYNWYNVGAARFLQTFTRNGTQFEPSLGNLSVDGGRGPEDANVRIGVEVTPDASTAGLEVNFGSVGFNTVADVDRTEREKSFELDGLDHSGSGEWEPLAAFRHPADEQNIVMQFTQIEPVATPGTNDKVVVKSTDSALVTADFTDPFDDGSNVSPRAPGAMSDYSTPLQFTESITEVPDHDGNTTTTAPYSVSRPGGFQISHATAQGGTIDSTMVSTRRVRVVPDPEIAVLYGKTGSAGDFTVNGNVKFDY